MDMRRWGGPTQTSGSFILHLMFMVHRLAAICDCLIVSESQCPRFISRQLIYNIRTVIYYI